MMTMRLFQSPLTPFNQAFDIVAAVAGVVVVSPLFIIAPIAIKLDPRGRCCFSRSGTASTTSPFAC
jgi:lipopolysaccharide/colanic/teichoic acid biosynthesis glycosyltransferase